MGFGRLPSKFLTLRSGNVWKKKKPPHMSLGAHKHLHKEEKLGKGKLMNLWLGLFSHGCSVHLVFCLEV